MITLCYPCGSTVAIFHLIPYLIRHCGSPFDRIKGGPRCTEKRVRFGRILRGVRFGRILRGFDRSACVAASTVAPRIEPRTQIIQSKQE